MGARTEQKRTVIGNRFSATDRHIDRLVYEPCVLSEETAVVEGTAQA